MRKPVSLSHFLGIGNLYLIVIPLLLAGGWGLFVLDDAMRRTIVSTNEASASIVAGRLEEFFLRPGEALEAISSLMKREDPYNADQRSEQLRDALNTWSFLDQIQIAGRDGRIRWLAPPNPEILGVSRSGEAVFEGVRKATGIFWSPSYISLKRERVAISFGVTRGDYTILCDLNLGEVGRFTENALRAKDSPVEIRITDEKGVFVSHPDPGQVLRRENQVDFSLFRQLGANGGSIEMMEAGKGYIVSVARVSEPAWYVLVFYPKEAIFDLLFGYYAGFIVIMVSAIAFGILFSRLRVNRLRVSLDRIADKAGKIAEGRYQELSGFGEDFSELRRVGHSFNGMVAGIRHREENLLDRERGFREILENIHLIALGLDLEGRVVLANPFLLSLSGYSWDEIAGSDLSRFVPPGYSLPDSPFMRILSGRSTEDGDVCTMRMKDGSFRIIDWTITANRDATGKLSGATGIGMDVTESRKQRSLIEASLKEKEVLLKEVHHRVKNNLQVISSLLSLQRSSIDDPAISVLFEESEQRVRSMAMIHENLYRSGDLSSIDLVEYLRELTSGISSTVGAEWLVEGEKIFLGIDRAVPCALAVNELTMNAVKHASMARGQVHCALSVRFQEGTIAVDVVDNGPGLPADFDPASHKGLGLSIVSALALQLGGSLDWGPGQAGGARFTLYFPADRVIFP